MTTRHGAHAVKLIDGWHASDAQCGWHGRVCKSEENAERAAERHNNEGARLDAETHRLLYGPKEENR